jgi:hypothetical protein
MKDRLLSIFCGVGMVLSFATVVSWARSTVSSEGITLGHRYSRISLVASEGSLLVARGRLSFDSPQIEQTWRNAIDPEKNYDWSRWRFTWSRDLGSVNLPSGTFMGFGIESTIVDATRRLMPGIHWHRTTVQVPHWAVVMVMGAAPATWLYRRQRARWTRVSRGLCRKCGFEMGNIYHLCPKCGERAPLPEGFPVIDPH